MNTSAFMRPVAAFPITELEEIESAIQSSAQWLATLHIRREKLMSELEQITRPDTPPLQAVRPFRGPGFEYRGECFRHWTYIDIHVGLLRKLWNDFPERREAMAYAMGRYGYSRNYVAASVEGLFSGMPAYKARKFSRRLIDGWYVDTNINLERMRRILPAAVHAAGLKINEEVRIFWWAEKNR